MPCCLRHSPYASSAQLSPANNHAAILPSLSNARRATAALGTIGPHRTIYAQTAPFMRSDKEIQKTGVLPLTPGTTPVSSLFPQLIFYFCILFLFLYFIFYSCILFFSVSYFLLLCLVFALCSLFLRPALTAQALIQKVLQPLASRRMAQLAQGLGFDLADSFSCNVELLADFLQGSRAAVLQSEAQTDYLALTLGQ